MIKIFFMVMGMIISLNTITRAQVTISAPAARYFLEMEERARVLDSVVFYKQQQLNLMKEKFKAMESNETAYNQEIMSLEGLLKIEKEQHQLTKEVLKATHREVRKQRRQKLVSMGAGTGALIGTFVDQPLTGAVIGGGIGYVISLFGKRK